MKNVKVYLGILLFLSAVTVFIADRIDVSEEKEMLRRSEELQEKSDSFEERLDTIVIVMKDKIVSYEEKDSLIAQMKLSVADDECVINDLKNKITELNGQKVVVKEVINPYEINPYVSVDSGRIKELEEQIKILKQVKNNLQKTLDQTIEKMHLMEVPQVKDSVVTRYVNQLVIDTLVIEDEKIIKKLLKKYRKQ